MSGMADRCMRGLARPCAIGWLCGVVVLLAPASMTAAAGSASIEGTVTILDREGKPRDRHEGVVVFLDELENPPRLEVSERATMRQLHKRFLPEVLPILAGTTVDFPNDDVVYHNVFSLSRVKPFDLGLYEQGGVKAVTFDQPGLVKIYCNIHPQMVGHILVLANPYFTVTDRKGRFVLPEVPLGAVLVRTWYPRSRQHPEVRLRVSAQGIQDLELRLVESVQLEIREERFSLEHKNKWGEDYPTKY